MKRYIFILALVLMFSVTLTSCGLIRGGEYANAQETEAETETVEEAPPTVYPDPDGKKVVILDAGHGFRDVGCDTDLMDGCEADVTIAVTSILKEKLEKCGVKVIMTHDGVTYPTVEEMKALADKYSIEYADEEMIENDIFSAYERAVYSSAVAKKENADLFLSLHVNSIEGHPEHSQYEMDYYAKNPYASAIQLFCEDLASKLDNKSRISADEFENAFRVTKHGAHPSVLFEMGYATNETDAEKLNSPQWREDLCETITDCIVEWINEYEEK